MEKITFDKEYANLMFELPDSLEEYQHWLGLKKRKIYFNDEVDLGIISKIVYWIKYWNDQDDKAGLTGEDRPEITVYVSSNGGDVISGFSVIDAIKSSKTKVKTVGIGVCASMGALLLMSGHERIAYPNTVILLHDGSLSVQSSTKKAKNTMNFFDRLDERIKKFVLENSKISKGLYEEKEDQEWYMFANDEGIKLGIIDGLIE